MLIKNVTLPASDVTTAQGTDVQVELDALNQFNEDTVPDDVFIGSFFNSDADNSLTLFHSAQGTRFTRMNTYKMTTPDNRQVGNRDPSILFHKGYWLVACTTGGNTNEGSTDADFLLYRSKDLINWELKKCTLGPTKLKGQPGSVIGGTISTISPVWAPSLFVDNDTLYVQVSVGYKPQTTDIEGGTVNWCAPFSSKCLDDIGDSWEFPVLMMSDTSVPRIDVEMAYRAGTYILCIKNEYNKHIEVWTSSTYIGGYTRVADLDFGRFVEGPSLVYINSKGIWRLYADAWREHGTTYARESTDLISWAAPFMVEAAWPLRHGTVYNVSNNPDAALAVSTFSNACAFFSENENQPAWSEGGTLAAGTNTIRPKTGYVYRVGGSTSASVVINEATAEWFYLLVASGTDSAGISVSGTKVDGTFSIGYGQTNLRLYKVMYNKASALYNVVGRTNENGAGTAFNLVTGWPTITSAWVPKHGQLYTTSGAMSATTIASLNTNLPDGTEFHMWIGSQSTGGSIVISSGGSGLEVGSSDVILSGATGHGNRVFTFKKLAGIWRLCAF